MVFPDWQNDCGFESITDSHPTARGQCLTLCWQGVIPNTVKIAGMIHELIEISHCRHMSIIVVVIVVNIFSSKFLIYNNYCFTSGTIYCMLYRYSQNLKRVTFLMFEETLLRSRPWILDRVAGLRQYWRCFHTVVLKKIILQFLFNLRI